MMRRRFGVATAGTPVTDAGIPVSGCTEQVSWHNDGSTRVDPTDPMPSRARRSEAP